jgi:hypothetical protein
MPSRREFLKTAVGLVGLAAVGPLPAHPVAAITIPFQELPSVLFIGGRQPSYRIVMRRLTELTARSLGVPAELYYGGTVRIVDRTPGDKPCGGTCG